MEVMARLATIARDVAGPQASPAAVQSESRRQTVCEIRHIRMGPGVPVLLGTQMSVSLRGRMQLLGVGMVHVLVGALQVLLVAMQVLSVLRTQLSCGN